MNATQPRVEREIRCMASLLGDRSVRVRNRAAVSLERALPESQALLEECRASEPDPLIRERLGLILALSATSDPLEHWRIMREAQAFNLRDGLVAIALLDQEKTPRRIDLLERLNALGDAWYGRLAPGMSVEEKTFDLMAFLYGPDGFHGNTDDYYSLDNCFLHRLLYTKKGIPVTLCCLAVILAEEEGLPVHGIGLPLHFITGLFQGVKGIRFFDCFDAGKEVTAEECEQYLFSRGIFFHPQLLSPCESEVILNRILVNTKHIASRRKIQHQLRSVERLAAGEELKTT